MTLARVGSGEGPDLARLRQIMAKNAGRQLYAAGGVRDLDDLKGLSDAGAAGVLVASALHDGRIGPDALATSPAHLIFKRGAGELRQRLCLTIEIRARKDA